MSHDHTTPVRPVNAWVVTVSSTRTLASDTSGALVASLLSEAGHQVLDRTLVPDDVDALRTLVHGLAGDGTTQVVVLTGGTGVALRDVTPDALAPLYSRELPGFGELFRALTFQELGAVAMFSRANAGLVGPLLVFSLPGSPEACRLGLQKLVLPELSHLVRELNKEGTPEAPPAPGITTAKAAPAKPAKPAAKAQEPAKKAEPEKPSLPAPSGSLGRLGKLAMTVDTSQDATRPEAAGVGADGADLPTGWLRAVYELKGEVEKGTYPEIPEELEKVAPIIDVLHTSGARGTLKLPDGRAYALFGWPNLEKGAKVLAIGHGLPVAEILALHRYPVITGTCVDGDKGLAPARPGDVAKVCEAVTGRVPKDTSGELFAVQGDQVVLQRGSRAIRWDGVKEKDDGTLKQVLATLVLDWSRR
jgi:molybdopterin adenylyltransferase